MAASNVDDALQPHGQQFFHHRLVQHEIAPLGRSTRHHGRCHALVAEGWIVGETRAGAFGQPCRRTSSRRPYVPAATPHPGAPASADTVRKTNRSDTPRDWLAGILPTPTAKSDGDAVGFTHEWLSSTGCD